MWPQLFRTYACALKMASLSAIMLLMTVLCQNNPSQIQQVAPDKKPAHLSAKYNSVSYYGEKHNPPAKKADKNKRCTPCGEILKSHTKSPTKSFETNQEEEKTSTPNSGTGNAPDVPSVYLGAEMKNEDLTQGHTVSVEAMHRDLDIIPHGYPVKVPSRAFPATTPDHPDHGATHFPYMKDCPICRACMTQNQQCRRASCKGKQVKPDELPTPKKLLDAVTADHTRCGKNDSARNGDTCAVVIQDRHTTWICVYPMRTHTTSDTSYSLRRGVGPQAKPDHIYTDDAGGFAASTKALGWAAIQDTSTPYRPQTHGTAERAVRRVKEGTRCALMQAGLQVEWWAEAMQCFCFLWNIAPGAGRRSPCRARFGHDVKGPRIPFGAAVIYKPTTPQDESLLHQYHSKCLDGIFMGDEQQSGGGWSGNLLIAQVHQLQTVEQAQHVHVRTVPHTQVSLVLNRANAPHHIFPVFTGERRQPPSRFTDTRLNTVNLRRTVIDEAGEEHMDEEEEAYPETLGSSRSAGPQPPVPAESSEPTDRSVHGSIGGVSDYWTVSATAVVRHHVTPRMRLYITHEAASPIPMLFLDVVRPTLTNLEDSTDAFVQDVWILEAPLPEDTRLLSGDWTGKTICRVLGPEALVGSMWYLDKLIQL